MPLVTICFRNRDGFLTGKICCFRGSKPFPVRVATQMHSDRSWERCIVFHSTLLSYAQWMMDKWLAILRPFQQYFDGRVIMKGCAQWNQFMIRKSSASGGAWTRDRLISRPAPKLQCSIKSAALPFILVWHQKQSQPDAKLRWAYFSVNLTIELVYSYAL